jgi:3-hydroxyisobutyrate dehydrogenase
LAARVRAFDEADQNASGIDRMSGEQRVFEVRWSPGVDRPLGPASTLPEDLVTQTVAVLGTGIMGSGMARNLIAAGLDVTVWNRSPDRARPLAGAGARMATDAAEAVAGADVVVTMLFDTDAVAQVMEWALPAVAPGAVWAQTSTVGLHGAVRLAELAARHDVGIVDAPVLGTRQPAEQGTLTVLAGGPSALREAVTPVFDAIGSKTVWVGEQPGDGQKLKLVANSWIGSVITGIGQAVAFAERLDLDPQMFLDTIAGGPLDLPYGQLKGRAMIAGEFAPAFAVSGVVKDLGLIAAAMRGVDVRTEIVDAVAAVFGSAEAAGHGGDDMAAVVEAFRPKS